LRHAFVAISLAAFLGSYATQPLAQTACPGLNPELRQSMMFTPDTVSPQAQAALNRMAGLFASGGPAAGPPPKTAADWDRLNAHFTGFIQQMDAPRLATFAETGHDDTLNGVKIIRIGSASSAKDGRVLIFAHGGGYTMGSSRSSLLEAVEMAHATGLPVISVDYRLVPHGNWQTATDEVLKVYSGLLKEGHRPDQIGMFGGSAGGGLIAGSVFKIRDQGLPLPGALVLGSPWSDITESGDSYCTLANADPILTYAGLKVGADLYAPPKDQKNPYVSPVYGDYAKGYPPMLIQGGTREIFLSNFVRQYQAAVTAGQTAVLDLYEGMPHGFPAFVPDAPEGQQARKRAATFFATYLKAQEPK
jgi:epsilon-lactone hydrolase